MPTAQKIERVRELKEQLTESSAALLSDYRGVTVKDVTELRQALLEAEATFTVVKNTLTKLAAVEAGLAGLESLLEGPTAITFVKGDVVLAAKRLADAAKRVPLKASLSRTAYALVGVQSRFLAVLDAYKEKVPPGEAPASEASAEESTEVSADPAEAEVASGEAQESEPAPAAPAEETPEPEDTPETEAPGGEETEAADEEAPATDDETAEPAEEAQPAGSDEQAEQGEE
ncbi:MAG: 50S ribosomal protein L10 [Actinobacteria bacterium]|nr:50S ribosomal protein L10 [Actinomycetota bacterium]